MLHLLHDIRGTVINFRLMVGAACLKVDFLTEFIKVVAYISTLALPHTQIVNLRLEELLTC
jgi:hypothetical protein